MHMVIGSKTNNVKLVYVGQNNAIQDSLLVPCCKEVLPLCSVFSFAFQSPESNVIKVTYWIWDLCCCWFVWFFFFEFTCIYVINEQWWYFSKVSQQQGANYLTPFCQKLVKDHDA